MESTSDYWRIWYYLLESLGLAVALVNSSQARQLAGRPKTDRLDAQWLARLAEMGLLRRSFVPPPQIRALRDLARTRVQLVRDRTREWQRLEKLLEGALVKLSSELSSLARVKTARLILDALAAGETSPQALAGLALGSLAGRRPQLEQSLEGMMLCAHHARLIRIHLDHITFLDRAVAAIEDDIAASLHDIPAAGGVDADGEPSADPGPGAAVLPADARLAEIPGITLELARAIIAETGLDMTIFGTPARLVSWARRCPQTRQSGTKTTTGKAGKGNPYLNAILGEIAASAGRTDTFLGERYRRLARRRGKRKALVAVARSILVIIFHLLADPEARFRDLGPGYYDTHIDRQRKIRNHIRQLEALGLDVTTAPKHDVA
jgi:transposase